MSFGFMVLGKISPSCRFLAIVLQREKTWLPYLVALPILAASPHARLDHFFQDKYPKIKEAAHCIPLAVRRRRSFFSGSNSGIVGP